MLVVGAGPAGLSCALALRAHGVGVTILEERSEDELRQGSRAIYTHRASLELLEQMRPGLGFALARSGVVWSTIRTLWRGREVYSRSFPPPAHGVLPPFTSLPQSAIERQLIEACTASGVELVWNARAQAIATDSAAVEVTTSAGGVWVADWVVGADGARSAVRRAIGVAMRGSRSENAYVIVDVEDDPLEQRPVERVFHYEHPAAGGRNVLVVPFRGGWRVDLQCRRDDDPEQFDRDDGLLSWVAGVMGERSAQRIRWVSTYRFLQVVADEFIDESGRVLLIGEAAHLFAPFGARGMNSGIADAHAAAAAIHAAGASAERRATRAAAEGFAQDRRAAAIANRRAAGQALVAIQGRRPWPRAKRRLAVAFAPRVERAATWLDSAPYGPRLRRSRRSRRTGY